MGVFQCVFGRLERHHHELGKLWPTSNKTYQHVEEKKATTADAATAVVCRENSFAPQKKTPPLSPCDIRGGRIRVQRCENSRWVTDEREREREQDMHVDWQVFVLAKRASNGRWLIASVRAWVRTKIVEIELYNDTKFDDMYIFFFRTVFSLNRFNCSKNDNSSIHFRWGYVLDEGPKSISLF